MSEREIEKHGEKMLKKANVTGYAKTLQPKIRDGKVYPDEMVLQVHVTEKVPERELRKRDLIPKSVADIPTDVVVVGELKALGLRPLSKPKIKKKTDKHRPLVHGVSIGNEEITAGTNGNLVVGADGEIYEATNAHVVVDDVSLDPADVVARRILQPGPYDISNSDITPYVAGEYHWHKKLYPVGAGNSECPIGNAWAAIYNFFAELAEAETRLKAVIEQAVNHIDFGVWKPTVDWTEKFFDSQLQPDLYVGQGFAGSNVVSLICKAPYIVNEGYKPYRKPFIGEVNVGTVFHKSGRTSCYTKAPLMIQSAVEIVSYGAFSVKFDDVYVTQKLLDPGDSGSSCWVVET